MSILAKTKNVVEIQVLWEKNLLTDTTLFLFHKQFPCMKCSSDDLAY